MPHHLVTVEAVNSPECGKRVERGHLGTSVPITGVTCDILQPPLCGPGQGSSWPA